MNKYLQHVYVIPEDDCDRQLAHGFVMHPRVDGRRIQVMPLAGGWAHAVRLLHDEYVAKLRENPRAHVVLVVDFDGCFDDRHSRILNDIPSDIRDRVFVVGPKETPEKLKGELSQSFESIGRSLADDCDADAKGLWVHEQLSHNKDDRQRLAEAIRPFLFVGRQNAV